MIERGNWTELKPRKALIPWRRWRVIARFWIKRKADQRMELIRSRKRSMDMMRNLHEGGMFR